MQFSTPKIVGEVEVRSGEQVRFPLGVYYAADALKGFAIQINPEPADGAIVAKIVGIRAKNGGRKYVLHLANYGDRTVCAQVRSL